jgi:DNA repair protein RadC
VTDIIRDMPLDDRPREKLLAHGARTLSDAELIGILLGCGTYGKNAMQLARELLSGGINALAAREPGQIAKMYGMGTAKAARVAATFEIARRLAKEKPLRRPPFDVDLVGAELVRAHSRLQQERLGMYILDSRSRVIRQRNVFVGTATNALVSTRDILRYTLEENGVGVALYHNHPSGDPTPSKEDMDFTEKLRDGLALADIELVDHLVIGAHGLVSMKRKKLF